MASPADTLHLRNGSAVNGSFLGGTADDIQFLVNERVRHYARADVTEITFGSINPPSDVSDAPSIEFGPDIAGVPFLRGTSGYITLERVIAAMSRSGGVYGAGSTVYRVPGARSPVRVSQGDRLVFVVRFNSGGARPQFQLYRLDPRRDYRQTPPVVRGLPPNLPVTIHRVGPTVYEITPVGVLDSGEYAVSPTNSNESYCFGVD
jgi:hypothetical protein